MDGGAIARRVDRLPWVESTSVRRAWPGTVTIVVHERTPVAALAPAPPQNTFSLVDASGRVLQTRPGPAPAGVLMVAGGPPPPTPGNVVADADRAALAVAAAVPGDLRGKIAKISLVA